RNYEVPGRQACARPISPNAAPPDTNASVGATRVVQWVNESFAVFDKLTGALLLGPRAGNSIWAGFGGGCETNNDGDPIIQYDKRSEERRVGDKASWTDT